MGFKEAHPFEARARESARVRQTYPGRIPVILERSGRTDVPQIDKQKFLCPGDITLGQFCYIVRRRMTLPAEKALFLFVGETLHTNHTLIRELYSSHKDPDGFLYMTYMGESTFGTI
jgi:GABA(A) receptor-associated protein